MVSARSASPQSRVRDAAGTVHEPAGADARIVRLRVGMSKREPARRPQAGSVRDRIRSPCVGVCELDASGHCRGCWRTLEEVAGWITYTDTQREAIIANLERRKVRSS